MLRIITTLGFIAFFAFAENCNFENESQTECEIDLLSPPMMLHKFVRNNGAEYSEYQPCKSAGSVELNGRQLAILDCSMVESRSGDLTEGISITNGKNLLKTKHITLKQNNILLRVAGDFIIDSGVRFNTKGSQNLVLEIIEGTNTKSNLVLERGASMRVNALIMPEGSNSTVWLNTYYGGIYEREFIDLINQKSAESRGGMETLLIADDMLSLSVDGTRRMRFNGNIFCGPKDNPLDLNTKNTLKRIYKAKNNLGAVLSDDNANCSVKEGMCFENILDFHNQKIDGNTYKVATAEAKIIPTYDIFIESGKITSSNGKSLASIAPNAKIQAQNYGKCDAPTKVAFEQTVIDAYLASLNGEMISDENALIASLETNKGNMPKGDKNAQGDSHSPIKAEMEAELDENLQDLLKTFGMQKEADKLAKAKEAKEAKAIAEAKSKKEKEADSMDLGDSKDLAKGDDGVKIASDSSKEADLGDKSKTESSTESTQIASDSTNDSQVSLKDIADASDLSESKKDLGDLAKATNSTKSDSTKSAQIAQDSSQDSNKDTTQSDSSDSQDAPKAIADASGAKSQMDSIESKKDAIDSGDSSDLGDSTKTADSSDSTDEGALKDALLADKQQKPTRKPRPFGKDEFLLVEKEAYNSANKECYGDLKCLAEVLRPFDGVVWSKQSSKERVNTLYAVNISDDNLKIECEVRNYYGKNIKKTYNLSHTNTLATVDMKFALSQDRAQVLCKTRQTTKATNKIITTPAKFDLQYSFVDEGSAIIPTLKAGKVRIEFKESRALTLEGDIDNGFNGKLAMQNLTFTQKNKCDGKTNGDISAPRGMNLNFKKGYLQNAYADLEAHTVAFGRLNIDFAIPNNDKLCNSAQHGLKPKCVGANITKDISIIPANFRVKTDILADSGSNQIAYYGQIDDKNTFKYNPLLSLNIEALNSDNKPIDINKACNYGSIELSLANEKLIEFKRSSSDRLNSKIVAYLRDFEKPEGTSIRAYFGISKIVDKYKNSRTIAQGDVLEPREVTLMDFKFNVRFRNGTSQFDYDNLEVYDRLDAQSNPLGILFVRGKLQTNDIKGDLQDAPSLIAKYALYCKSCDKRVLKKYLQSDPEIESQFWYINTKHPSGLYLSDSYIKMDKDNAKFMEVKNSNEALEGRQQITFMGKKGGIYPIAIAQRSTEFAPYLNYNEKHKNSYITNSFSVMISEDKKQEGDIVTSIRAIKSDSTKTQKSNVTQKITPKVAPKATQKASATTPKATQGNIMLDIEE